MRRHPASAALLAVPLGAVLLLAGCSAAAGGGSSAAGGGAAGASSSSAPKAQATTAATAASASVPSDPCALITKAEASKVLGSAVAGTLRQGTSCTYDNEEYEFAVELYPHGGDDQWTAALVGLKAQFGRTPAISGLGDKAVGIGGWVVVQTGATVLEVQDTYADKDPHLAHAIALAKIALGRL